MLYNIFPDDSVKKSYTESILYNDEESNFSLDIRLFPNSYETTELVVKSIYELSSKIYNEIIETYGKNDKIIIWYSEDSLDYLKYLIAVKMFSKLQIFEINCSKEIVVDDIKIKNIVCNSIAPEYLKFYQELEEEISPKRKELLKRKINNFNLKWDAFVLNNNCEYEGLSFEQIDALVNSVNGDKDIPAIVAFIKYDLGINIDDNILSNRIKVLNGVQL